MEKLGDALKKLTQELNLAPAWDTGTVLKHWGQIVGESVAAHCEPIAIRDRILFVRTSSPVWSHQLSRCRHLIIEKLASYGVTVSDVRFRAGEVSSAPPDSHGAGPTEPGAPG